MKIDDKVRINASYDLNHGKTGKIVSKYSHTVTVLLDGDKKPKVFGTSAVVAI